jgi:ParB family chromosome partitioning protein
MMDLFSSPKARRLVRLTDIEDNPYQVRTDYDESMLISLAASIQDLGLLQIPVARRVGDKYQMAFGHRRRRAFERLCQNGFPQYEQMPIDVMELSDQQMFETSLSENLKRADLSPIEKAAALKQYMELFHASSTQAARLFGIPESTIRGTVRLLNLPEEAREKVSAGQLSQNQARKLLERPETQQKRTARREEHFNLREELIVLLYDHMRWDVDDQRLFKKIKSLVETNQQLERQLEVMNGRRLERAQVDLIKPKMQPASMAR